MISIFTYSDIWKYLFRIYFAVILTMPQNTDILYSTMQNCTVMYYIEMYGRLKYINTGTVTEYYRSTYTLLQIIVLHCTVLYYIASYCILFYYIVLYFVVFNFIVLDCIVLYCIILYQNPKPELVPFPSLLLL